MVVRKILCIKTIESREIIFHVGEVDGDINQILPFGTGGLQDFAHIIKHRPALRLNIVVRNIAIGSVDVARDLIAARKPGPDTGQE